MRIIALEVENKNVEPIKFKELGKEEAKILWLLYQKGIVREFYFRDDENSAVLILESENLKEARKALSQLPYVKNELISFDLIPLKPYPGFERLFSDNE